MEGSMPEREIGRGGHCNMRPDPAVLKGRWEIVVFPDLWGRSSGVGHSPQQPPVWEYSSLIPAPTERWDAGPLYLPWPVCCFRTNWGGATYRDRAFSQPLSPVNFHIRVILTNGNFSFFP